MNEMMRFCIFMALKTKLVVMTKCNLSSVLRPDDEVRLLQAELNRCRHQLEKVQLYLQQSTDDRNCATVNELESVREMLDKLTLLQLCSRTGERGFAGHWAAEPPLNGRGFTILY